MRKANLIILLLSMLFLAACGRGDGVAEETIPFDGTDMLVRGIDELTESYCVKDSGIIYADDNRIRYYDLSSDETYILCDKVNCFHSDEKCSAWYESYADVTGVAMFQNRIYMFRKNQKSNTYDLISMDVTGNDQKVIAQLDIGEYSIKSWVIIGLEDIYYCGNKVWFSANCKYMISREQAQECKQYLGIDLNTGEIEEVNERTIENTEYSIESISEDKLVFLKRWSESEYVSEEEFYAQYEAGEFGSEIEETGDLYYNYLYKWYPQNCQMMDSYIIYDIETGEETILEEGLTPLNIDDNGDVVGYLPKYNFLGQYNGEFLCSEPDYEGRVRVFLWDTKKGYQENLLNLENGGMIAIGSGSVSDNLIEETKLLYCVYLESGKADIYIFDIETRQSKRLFEDERNISFRIIDDTQDLFIGKIYSSFGYDVYAIQKEDYYAGEFEMAKKLNL